MSKYVFYTKGIDGNKKLFQEVDLGNTNYKKPFHKAVNLLKAKSRDISDFLHIKGKHLYFWNERIIWDIF
ncbi:hypothetical protein IT402_02410 [Candidatus Nomurabacteria bacterium]|nr:hypothetical protein [Candidatus Nomurabacteria bacterium]